MPISTPHDALTIPTNASSELGSLRVRIGRAHPSPTVATAMIATVTVMYSFVAVFARRLADVGLAPAGVALHRYLLTAVLMAGFLRLDRGGRTATLWGIGSGMAMGVGWMAYARAVVVLDVATVSVAYMTYPLFTLAGGWLLFGRAPAPRAMLGGVLIVLASAVAIGSGSVEAGAAAIVVAFAAPIAFGTSIAVLTERLGTLDAFERLAAVTVGAVLGLAVPVLRLPLDRVVPSTAGAWVLTLGIGVTATLIPMLLYAIAAPSVGAARSAMTGAVELPALFVVAALLFDEAIGWREVAAGALIVAAIALSPTTASTPSGSGLSTDRYGRERHDHTVGSGFTAGAIATADSPPDPQGSVLLRRGLLLRRRRDHLGRALRRPVHR